MKELEQTYKELMELKWWQFIKAWRLENKIDRLTNDKNI